MATKHTVTDKNGKIHKRVSQERVYSHAILVYIPATGPDNYGRTWPAYTRVEWASRRDLADKVAGSYRSRGHDVEVLPANLI